MLPLQSLLFWLFSKIFSFRIKNVQPNEKLNILEKMLLTPFREPGALYWKSIMIARRFVLVLLFCVATETSYNLFWTTLTCLLALFHHLRVKPFKHNWTNNLESISLLLLVVLGFINLYKTVLVEAEVLAPTDSFKVIQWLEIIILELFPASVCLLFSFAIISLFPRLLHVCYGSLFRCMFSGFSFSVIRYSGPPTVTYSHYKVNPMTDNVCGKTTLESFRKHNGDGNFVHDVAVAVAVRVLFIPSNAHFGAKRENIIVYSLVSYFNKNAEF